MRQLWASIVHEALMLPVEESAWRDRRTLSPPKIWNARLIAAFAGLDNGRA